MTAHPLAVRAAAVTAAAALSTAGLLLAGPVVASVPTDDTCAAALADDALTMRLGEIDATELAALQRIEIDTELYASLGEEISRLVDQLSDEALDEAERTELEQRLAEVDAELGAVQQQYAEEAAAVLGVSPADILFYTDGPDNVIASALEACGPDGLQDDATDGSAPGTAPVATPVPARASFTG